MRYRKIAIKENKNKVKSSTKNSLLDELLARKNILKKKEIDKFLNPTKKDFISPFAFCDMKKAKDRINLAIEKKETILVWGDFDCDGVTSTTVLYKALLKLNANVITFIPDRLEHGHGLNSKELVKLISTKKVKLVITVDCATSNVKEINLLSGLKVDTIITDHHSTDTDLPKAYAIINPQVKGALDESLSVEDITSLSYNSGSIIAFKLAMALLEDVEDEKLKDELLVIASSGAIADVVPLKGENRSMVSVALEILNDKKDNIQKGIYKLLNKNISNRTITSTDIAFILAPRINAAGRLFNASLSFEFLNCNDDNKLNIIIEKLDNYNSIRQAKCTEVSEDILNYIKNNPKEKDNPAIILLNPNWHIGIIGIVASKIVEEFNKPCFLMTVDKNNNARCSIRSNEDINVYSVLKENETLFAGFGGHRFAGGFSFSLDEISFDDIKDALIKTISELSSDNKKDDNILYADMELSADDIELDLLNTIDKFEPFGEENNPPLFAMFNVNLDEFKPIGKEQNHLRMVFSSGDKKINAVKWGENSLNIPLNSRCDIAFYPRFNSFNNTETVQLEIVDIYSNSIIKQSNESFKVFDHRKKTGILKQISTYLKHDCLDIKVWAKTISTKEKLSRYDKIKENFISDELPHKGLMIFDYPATKEEFNSIINQVNPKKIHFMNYVIDENIENYVKQINGMAKYSSNKLKGEIDIQRLAQTAGVSEAFLNITLEIMENLGSIKILDFNKIKYIKPFNYEEFKKDNLWVLLNEEFKNNIDFKKTCLNCDIKDIEDMIYNLI